MRTRNYSASAEKPYFYYDGEGNGFEYFATEAERDAAANEAIQACLDDGWAEGVEDIIAGKVTHTTKQIDVIHKPEVVDENGYDAVNDMHWVDYDTVCNYILEPIKETNDG